LFDLSDEFFVGAAYRRLLGRPADPGGYLNYLRLLRGGASRARVTAALAEGREGVPATWHDDVDRRVAEATGLDALTRRRPRIVVRRLDELFRLEGALFVEALATMVEGGLSAEATDAWVTRLGAGATKHDVLSWMLLLPDVRPLESPFSWAVRGRLLALQAVAWLQRPRTSQLPARPTLQPVRRSGLDACQPDCVATRPVVVIPAAARQALFTIASRNYLPYVRALMQSVRACQPDLLRYVLIVDEPRASGVADADLFTAIHACELGIPTFDDMSVRYDVVELNTALKPFFFDWLFSHSNLDSIVYLDPDIHVYAPLSRVAELLSAGASVVLTPHATAPLDAERGLPNDRQFLKTGVFNLGFIAMRRCDESRRFVAWWSARLLTDCLVDFAANLFTDQRWCDLAPCLLERLQILRDPTYNVAYWNVEQRPLCRHADGTWWVGSDRLVFYHFSGVDRTRPDAISKHQTRLSWVEVPGLRELFDEYLAELDRAGWALDAEAPYSYGSFRGAPVPRVLRQFYRSRNPQPRRGAIRESLLAELFADCFLPTVRPLSVAPDLTALMRFVSGSRDDLARIFDLSTREGRADYMHWFYAAAVHEYGLVDSVLRHASTGGAQ
jgi:hypothetical protein